jgi:hypothetical protein
MNLHGQLKARVREHQDYFERKHERRLDALMKFITFIAFPTSWTISIHGKGWHWGVDVLETAVVLYGGILLIWLAWVYLSRE